MPTAQQGQGPRLYVLTAVLAFSCFLTALVAAQAPGCSTNNPLVYDERLDVPEQQLMLKRLFEHTNGRFWSLKFVGASPADPAASQQPGSEVNDARTHVPPQIAPAEAGHLQPLLPPPDVAQGSNALQCQDVASLLQKCPWFSPGISYCKWLGITCCLFAGETTLRSCKAGMHSVASLMLPGANMTGHLPLALFTALSDLQFLVLDRNEGLTGPLPEAPAASVKHYQVFSYADTSIQQPCARLLPPIGRTGPPQVQYQGPCLPNSLTFAPNSAPVIGKPYMSCRSLLFNRPNISTPASATLANWKYGRRLLDAPQQSAAPIPYLGPQMCVIVELPQLFAYQGCTCDPLAEPHYYQDSRGTIQLECVLRPQRHQRPFSLASLLALVAGNLVLIAVLVVLKRSEQLREWELKRFYRLKRKHAPGTLKEGNGRNWGLVHNEVTLVLTDVQGSTALWEWNGAVMEEALEIHDSILRAMLPCYFGFEAGTEGDSFTCVFHDPIDAVGWAIHVQQALLEAPWPPQLLRHPDACEELAGGVTLFRGLRVRMAMNSGTPAHITVHRVTKQHEYHGELVALTETVSMLPAGGQILLSGATFERTYGRLHEVQLPQTTLHASRPRKADPLSFVGNHDVKGYCSALGESWTHDAQTIKALHPGNAKHTGSTTYLEMTKSALSNVLRCPSACGSQSLTSRCPSYERLLHEPCLALPPSLTVVDMGTFRFREYDNHVRRAELPPVSGVHVIQVLHSALTARAPRFPPLGPDIKIAPSFFDAPGARAVGWPDKLSTVPADITVVFCSPSGYKEALLTDAAEAEIALGQFKSVVRTTLRISDGYECQEKEGTFMMAFPTTRTAIEWAMILQLALLRVEWSNALLRMPATSERSSASTGIIMFRGLSARVGMFRGDVIKICPHITAGRADYFGTAVNRAARFLAACMPGQVLAEASMLADIWGDDPAALPAAASSHIAVRNCHMLAQYTAQHSSTMASHVAVLTHPRPAFHEPQPVMSVVANNIKEAMVADLREPFPVTVVPVGVHAMGVFAFKGLQELFEVVQVLPHSLAPRVSLNPYAIKPGKAVRMVEKDELCFTKLVTLFDVLDLCLAADPGASQPAE